jgi:cobalt-zinc-cadmium efflux system outer membrane protein
MRMGTRTFAVCAFVCLHASPGIAQRTLTLPDVVARAREQAPQIVSARLAMEEARGRLLGASLRFQENPEISGALGNRSGPDGRFTDYELNFDQALEPGARRAARVASARAALARSTASVDEVTRTVLHDAVTAYYRALHANERIRLLSASFELATTVYATADRRFKAGDIAVLDVNIARASLARVRAEREAAEASKTLALGELRRLLAIEDELVVDGSLSRPADASLDVALQSVSQRPELRALEAEIAEADADVRVGQSFSKPQYGLGVRYSREEGDQIILGGMTVSVPMFSQGQEQRAISAARASRLRAELTAARGRVQQEVRSAFDAYNRRLAAVRVLETDAISGMDENEQLTTRSFEVGQLGLPDLLLIRRELLDTRAQYLDALLAAALARTDLDGSAAILR